MVEYSFCCVFVIFRQILFKVLYGRHMSVVNSGLEFLYRYACFEISFVIVPVLLGVEIRNVSNSTNFFQIVHQD